MSARCPVCAGAVAPYCTSAHALLYRCPSCSHGFAAARGPSELYGDDYTGFRPDARLVHNLRTILETHVRPRLRQGAHVLDIGCGNGSFLRLAHELGYAARGIDTSAAAVAACRAQNLTADRLDLDGALGQGERYDLVTLWDVLEHVDEPRPFLTRARGLLEAGGTLLIKSPNVAARALGWVRLWPRLADVILQAPHHVQFFQRPTLDRLLAEAGFGRRDFHRCGALRAPRPTLSPRKLAARLLLRSSLGLRSPNLLVLASVESSP